jgi:hypothetical protein
MADVVSRKTTALLPDEVLVGALQYFSSGSGRWETTAQSSRSIAFRGKPPIPWLLLIATAIGLATCIVPGLVLYFMFVQKMYRFYNLVVAVQAAGDGVGTDVVVTHPDFAAPAVYAFLAALPEGITAQAAAPPETTESEAPQSRSPGDEPEVAETPNRTDDGPSP